MTFDRNRLAQIADWAAVAVAVSLPWSTTATSIFLVVWLLTLLPTLNLASVRRELETFAGGLPVLLWLLGVFGMLWSDVSWTERFAGLDSFHRLLVIPLLLAQFRRSGSGMRVVYGFLVSAVALLVASWTLALEPVSWQNPHRILGVPVHDVIAQSTIFLLCAFALAWHACDLLREGRSRTALCVAGLAVLFIGNLVFVATSRADLLVAVVLVVLLGWRKLRWKGAMIACLAAIVIAAVSWSSSSYLRGRLSTVTQDLAIYHAAQSDIGDHIEFLKKSMTFVGEAPVFGHGTGSIADLFRRAAVGERGSAATPTVNPHNQIFAVAIQLGLAGTALLLAMWAAHYCLFRSTSLTAWIGTVVVVQNIISSLTSSHLFDFVHGWLYVFGVGVVGGMILRSRTVTPSRSDSSSINAPAASATG